MLKILIPVALFAVMAIATYQLLGFAQWMSVLEGATDQPAAIQGNDRKAAEEKTTPQIKQETATLEMDEAESPSSLDESIEVSIQDSKSVIEMPEDGYSVEEASRYFLPKAQRTPGNLGGPPPPVSAIPETKPGYRPVEK